MWMSVALWEVGLAYGMNTVSAAAVGWERSIVCQLEHVRKGHVTPNNKGGSDSGEVDFLHVLSSSITRLL